MLWWDWTGRQRLALLAAMLAIAAAPWLWLGWLPDQWAAFAGGTAFLTIPQLVGWFLFVGLRTGRMPVRGGVEARRDSQTWFWMVAAIYGALLLLFLWAILALLIDLAIPPS